MFLSGTFGLSEGVALYPQEDVKGEFWSPYRRVTDLPVSPAAIEAALRDVAKTFYSVLDPAPSGAGLALTVAVDPTLVTFDMVRTALHLHLERAGVPSASLATTLDQIQRHQGKIRERGGNITRVEMTFFLPAEGYTITPFGSIRSEELEEVKARALRASEESKRTEREVRAAEKLERVAELQERSLKDEQIVGTKAELVQAQDEVNWLKARVAELEAEKQAKDEAALALAVDVAEREAIEAPELQRATVEAREARRESVERAQEVLDELGPARVGVTRRDVEEVLTLEVVEDRVRRAALIPFLPEDVVALAPEDRGARVVPLVRPAEEAPRPRPSRTPWNKKHQDARGRWRDAKSRFTSPPKRRPAEASVALSAAVVPPAASTSPKRLAPNRSAPTTKAFSATKRGVQTTKTPPKGVKAIARSTDNVAPVTKKRRSATRESTQATTPGRRSVGSRGAAKRSSKTAGKVRAKVSATSRVQDAKPSVRTKSTRTPSNAKARVKVKKNKATPKRAAQRGRRG